MGKLFGTDGIRGIANRDLSAQSATEIGLALGMVLRRENEGIKPKVLIGRDTRASGDMLEAAVTAGLCAGGADVVSLGVVPTPAAAYLVVEMSAQAAVMITASHNPYNFNGIKVFGPRGYKLTDAEEDAIEEIILDDSVPFLPSSPEEIGRRSADPQAVHRYARYVAGRTACAPGNIRLLADCANGSASATAREIFEALGARADFICNSPDGMNINNGCGSTHIAELAERVKAGGYDLGVAFDGDADRCLAVDEAGGIVDGDQLIAIFATDMRARGLLREDAVVVTVMSNYGFFRFAEGNGIKTVTTKVGDRYVLEKMREKGYNLGGEQSGHIIFLDDMTTGDGQLSAARLVGVMARSGKKLSELRDIIKILPQVMVNVEADIDMKNALAESVQVTKMIRDCEEELEGRGRVLIRPSGTEPLIRVMAEGDDPAMIKRITDTIAGAIKDNLA